MYFSFYFDEKLNELSWSNRYDDTPTTIMFWRHGGIAVQSWEKDGKYHRIGKPAIIRYSIDNGSIDLIQYFINGIEIKNSESRRRERNYAMTIASILSETPQERRKAKRKMRKRYK